MWLYALGSWLITAANVVFWLLIFRKRPFSRLAKSYFWWALFITFWSVGYGITLSGLLKYDATLAWNRWCQAMAALVAPYFFRFVCLVVQQESAARRFFRWYFALSVVNAIGLITSSTYVAGLWSFGVFRYQPLGGPLYPLFTMLFWVATMHAYWIAWTQFKKMRGVERAKIKLFLIGTGIAYTGAGSLFLQGYRIPLPSFGVFLVLVYVVMIGYLVYRYQFFDVRIVTTRTGLLLGIYLVVLGVPFLIGWWGRAWLESWLGREWWLVPLGLCTVLATAGPFAYAFLRRQAEAKLLKDQRRYQRTLQMAARGMTQVRNITKLSTLITRVVSRSVRLTHASLFLWDKVHQRYVLQASHGPKRLAVQSRYGLELSHPLIQWLKSNQRVLTEEELSFHPDAPVSEELSNLGAGLVVPGFIQEDLVGFLVLGPKRSGAGYSADDLHAFSTLAHEAAIAIENAQSYEELLRLNEQLKAASDRLLLQERLAAAGRFAVGMAHEVKNPLSAIKTFAQYLPEKYQDPAFREKFFRIVQGEIDRINTIVKELSDFAKPAPLDLQPIHLSELLEDTIDLLSNQCLKQGVEVRKAFGENGTLVQADPQQLKQVVLNLMLNSLEAMPEGGCLDVATSLNGAYLKLRIQDTGCGIAPDRQAEIWDPFFTTKERGMGLGLAIVRGVVERHGGHIAISSTPRKGTLAEVNLPLPTLPSK